MPRRQFVKVGKRELPPRAKGTAHSKRVPTAERPPDRIASDELRVLAFVDAYRTCFSATEAAIAAGYAPKHAGKAGWRLMHDPRVQEILAKYALDAQASANVRSADILRALSEIAFLDPAKLYEQRIHPETGLVTMRFLELTEMPVEIRRCISSVKVIKKNLVSGDGFIDTILEVKFWSKTKALELLAQHKNLLAEKSDDAVTQKQLDTMSDEELAETLSEAQARWNRHVAARAKSRLALVSKKETA